MLIAGDKGGSIRFSRVFMGLGLGALYTLFQNGSSSQPWPDTPAIQPEGFPGASLRGNTTTEYLGVGYIIGPRIAGVIFAGGVFAWLVVMPAIKFFGGHLTVPLIRARADPHDVVDRFLERVISARWERARWPQRD